MINSTEARGGGEECVFLQEQGERSRVQSRVGHIQIALAIVIAERDIVPQDHHHHIRPGVIRPASSRNIAPGVCLRGDQAPFSGDPKNLICAIRAGQPMCILVSANQHQFDVVILILNLQALGVQGHCLTESP